MTPDEKDLRDEIELLQQEIDHIDFQLENVAIDEKEGRIIDVRWQARARYARKCKIRKVMEAQRVAGALRENERRKLEIIPKPKADYARPIYQLVNNNWLWRDINKAAYDQLVDQGEIDRIRIVFETAKS
jgi:hypothetical protein